MWNKTIWNIADGGRREVLDHAGVAGNLTLRTKIAAP